METKNLTASDILEELKQNLQDETKEKTNL